MWVRNFTKRIQVLHAKKIRFEVYRGEKISPPPRPVGDVGTRDNPTKRHLASELCIIGYLPHLMCQQHMCSKSAQQAGV